MEKQNKKEQAQIKAEKLAKHLLRYLARYRMLVDISIYIRGKCFSTEDPTGYNRGESHENDLSRIYVQPFDLTADEMFTFMKFPGMEEGDAFIIIWMGGPLYDLVCGSGLSVPDHYEKYFSPLTPEDYDPSEHDGKEFWEIHYEMDLENLEKRFDYRESTFASLLYLQYEEIFKKYGAVYVGESTQAGTFMAYVIKE